MSSAEPVATLEQDIVIHAAPTDERTFPVFTGLFDEYYHRYGDVVPEEEFQADRERFPPSLFVAPDGGIVLLMRGKETIAGGAFMRHDEQTAELKRVWTHKDYRRQGLARKIVEALEEQAQRAGYRRIFLSTGFRQPEAVALYQSLGYWPLFDLEGDWQAIFILSFEKVLHTPETLA